LLTIDLVVDRRLRFCLDDPARRVATAGNLNQSSKRVSKGLMDENKRKQIEAKLFQLFTQTDRDQGTGSPARPTPQVVKVIRRRKGKPDRRVA